jgi:hypothetical protein
MKSYFRPFVLLLIMCCLACQTGFATPPQQVANDKVGLANQLETLMRKSSLWNSSKGRVEADASLTGKAFYFILEGEEATS